MNESQIRITNQAIKRMSSLTRMEREELLSKVNLRTVIDKARELDIDNVLTDAIFMDMRQRLGDAFEETT